MPLDYQPNSDIIKKRLEVAHNPDQSIVRCQFFDAENIFFRKHVFNQRVLIAGSGLGNDSFELAKYNNEVIGIDLIQSFVEYAKKEAKGRKLKNVHFECKDITKLDYPEDYFDSAVLNMGTIGNFDDKEKIISSLLKISKKLYFDFYPPIQKNLKKRKKMYEQEKWINVRIDGTKIVSDDGLDSLSLSEEEISRIIKSMGASVKYYRFHEFSIMAEVIKNKKS